MAYLLAHKAQFALGLVVIGDLLAFFPSIKANNIVQLVMQTAQKIIVG